MREVEGSWPAECVHRAFVAGASWWQFYHGGATMFPSEYDVTEAEAIRRYGEPVDYAALSQSHTRLLEALREVMAYFPPDDVIFEIMPDQGLGIRPCPMEKSPKDADVVRWRAALSEAAGQDAAQPGKGRRES